VSDHREGDAQGSSGPIWRPDETSAAVERVPDPRSSLLWEDKDSHRPEAAPLSKRSPWDEGSDVATVGAPEANGKSHAKPPPPPKLEPRTERRSEKEPRHRAARSSRAKRVRRVVWVLVVVALLAFIGDAAYSITGVRSALETSADELTEGRSAIEAGDLGEARASFEDARAEAGEARDLLDRPALSIAAVLPFIERDFEVIDDVALSAEQIAGAGLDGADIAEGLGVTDDGLAASIYEDGVVKLDELEAVQPDVKSVAAALEGVEARLEGSPRPVIGPLQEALARARRDVNSAADTARNGASLFAALPELLGGDGPRDYLLAFQALGESRGTGGVIGLYGVLHAEDGRLELGRIGHSTDIVRKAFPTPVEAPGWFERSYGPQYALRQWQQANSSPNFPVVSQVLLDMFEEGTGEALDGVIAMDPLALEELMRGTGPLEIEGGDSISASEVGDVLMRDTYVEFEDNEEQTLQLARYVRSFWSDITAGEFDPAALGSGLAEAARMRHVSVFTNTAETQEAMEEIGASGDYAPSGDRNVQMVFHNNYAVNKVDYFLRRSVRTDVSLTTDGEALVTMEATMKNLAPNAPPSLLLGPGVEGDEPGLNRMLFNFLAPLDTEFEKLWIDGDEVPIVEYTDGDFPVLWDVMEIPAGESVTVTVEYRVPNAISVEGGVPRFNFRLVPQALPTPERFTLAIEPPAGLALAEGHPDTPGIRDFSVKGTLDGPRSFGFVLVDPGSGDES
jgi:hypothetical protein